MQRSTNAWFRCRYLRSPTKIMNSVTRKIEQVGCQLKILDSTWILSRRYDRARCLLAKIVWRQLLYIALLITLIVEIEGPQLILVQLNVILIVKSIIQGHERVQRFDLITRAPIMTTKHWMVKMKASGSDDHEVSNQIIGKSKVCSFKVCCFKGP